MKTPKLGWLGVGLLGAMVGMFASPAQAGTGASCPAPWVCESVAVQGMTTAIRAGYLEAESQNFLGNVIYFEGLGDSMLNHFPLFQKLTRAGFRVIAFDYPGQGGSEGSMNQTSIPLIEKIGEIVWRREARDLDRFPEKRIIGWSTGGLAAYAVAAKRKASQVVLIAPGIAPRTFVGGGLRSLPIDKITLETLTTDRYSSTEPNPHLDPIRPNSPMKAPLFAVRLMTTALRSHSWKIDSQVQGFVLLSGEDDTYVDSQKTRQVLAKNAAHFEVRQYSGALHEIDNERPEIREPAHQDILRFLTSGKIDD